MRIRVANNKLLIYCDCLVDQGRYIGEDPVGYACFNLTEGRKTDEGLDICEWCYQHPERITFYPVPYRERQQKEKDNASREQKEEQQQENQGRSL